MMLESSFGLSLNPELVNRKVFFLEKLTARIPRCEKLHSTSSCIQRVQYDQRYP